MSEIPVPSLSITADPLANTQTIRLSLKDTRLSEERTKFLAKLPFFLNSQLKLQRVVSIALEHIQEELGAEAAVVYVAEKESRQLTYWALSGHARRRSEGKTTRDENSTVDMTFENHFPILLNRDALRAAPSSVLNSLGITPENQVGMPLLVRGTECVGVLQIFNLAKADGEDFSTEDIAFLEQFCHQVALAIDNAALLHEAQKQSAQLQELDRRKSEMISLIAHEFRTPLNIIRTASDLINKEAEALQESKEMLKLLRSGVDRLTRLISQIRNISLVQEQDIEIKREPLEVNSLCQEAVNKFVEISKERNLTLRFKGHADPVWVEGEASLLAIVLHNLMSNAVRFTPDGGTVLLRVAANAQIVRISVIDNGIGIAESEQPLVFEKFYEVNGIMNHSSGDYQFQSGGLGLGLAAVRHILQGHGTAVELQSSVGKGSSFSFTLPLIARPEAK